MGIKPLVVVQVETIKIVVEETNVYKDTEHSHFIFYHFYKDFGDEIQSTKGVMLSGRMVTWFG